MAKIVLKGITWGHSRGITPLVAYSQRFNELNPGIEITWNKRSLQEFADFPLEKLAPDYDLLIIDHPWVGCAAATGAVLPLDEYLSDKYLEDHLINTVGTSHLSYLYNGHQWALAIDAATPAASYREDLFKKYDAEIPQTWDDLLALAAKSKVALPAIPIDTLMNFYMFCIAHGEEPFTSEYSVISRETGIAALETMKELYSQLDKKMFDYNPIAVAEIMSRSDDYWYNPFAYCYSNYSRNGYADHKLTYAELVTFKSSGRLRSTIGGTGLAVSSYSKFPTESIHFAREIASALCQSTFYVQHGGQPAHKAAWTSPDANHITNDFFYRLLPTMENAYMRPRYNGYLHFQDMAGDPLQQYLASNGNAVKTLEKINMLYRQSMPSKVNQL